MTADAYVHRGIAYVQEREYDKAIEDYTKAIRLKPDYAGAYANRGYAYSRKGDRRRAKADRDKARSLGWNP